MDEQNKQVDTTAEELMAEDEIITLVNDDGENVNFYHVATLQHEEKWFIVLQPAEEMADIEEDEVVIFSLQEDESGEDVFMPVEDQELLDAVFEKFIQMTENDECGCDDEDCPGCGSCCDSHN